MRSRRNRRRCSSSGMTLIELMIAMVVLAVGLIAIANVVAIAIANNNRNTMDTSATMLSEMVLEQIQSVPASTDTVLTITDCAGNNLQINTAGGGVPGGIAGAALDASGNINYLQPEAAVPAQYAMDYTACGPGGSQFVYEIRWNIVNGQNTFIKVVTVSARRKMPAGTATASPNLTYFAPPVTLRGIAGN